MRVKGRNQQIERDENLDKKFQIPNDLLKPVKEDTEQQPEIHKINIRSKTLNRKKFIKSAASVAGLAALGTILKSCEESELDIIISENECVCHAVCTCDSEVD